MGIPKKSDRIDLDVLRTHLDNLDLTKLDNLNFWLYCRIAMTTGLRSIDVLNLKVSDISFQKGTATIIEQKTKKKIIVPIAQDIQRQIDLDQEFVIWNKKYGTNVSLMTVNRRLKKLFKGYDINVSSHSIRKSCARIVYEKSGNNIIKAMIFLNHSSPLTTKNYLAIDEDERSELYSFLDDSNFDDVIKGVHEVKAMADLARVKHQ